MNIKNDLYLRALRGELVERPPVWIMRQAGRYLPEFMALKDKYDFFTRCQTPDLASEITVQPIRRYGMDAAILFSDILVVPQAMNIEVEMKPNVGPWLPNPIASKSDIERVVVPSVQDELDYVFKAIEQTKAKLNDEIPLIGFAGAPWTIFCYCIEGQGSKTFDKARRFCFEKPELAHLLLRKITDTTKLYLAEKIRRGCNAVQIFDSWAGLLSPIDYDEFSWAYIQEIVDYIKDLAPVVVFAKGVWQSLNKMSKSGASALGLDWTISPNFAREKTEHSITLQGNFDPTWLFDSPENIKKRVNTMINTFGKDKYIVNLGHGILPSVPLQSVGAFVEAVKQYRG